MFHPIFTQPGKSLLVQPCTSLSCIPISPFRQRRRGRPSTAGEENDDALLEHASQLQSSPSQLLLVKAKSEVSLSAACSQPPQPVDSGNAPNKGEKGFKHGAGHILIASGMHTG